MHPLGGYEIILGNLTGRDFKGGSVEYKHG